jgi:hypothetical protein
MAKNKTFTGNRQSVGVPTMNKQMYYQIIREIRKGRENAQNQTGGEVQQGSRSSD